MGAATAAQVLERVLPQSINLVPEMYIIYIPTCSPVNNSEGVGTAARVRGQKYLVHEKYQRVHKYPERINYNVSRPRV